MTPIAYTPVSSTLRDHYIERGWWSTTETLDDRLAHHARLSGDKVAVVDPRGVRLTYAELDVRASAVAAGLAARGLVPGDVVSLQTPNWYEGVIAACGIERLGGIVNTLVPMYRDREIGFMTQKTGAKALFVPGNYHGFDSAAMGRRLTETVPSLNLVVSFDSASDGGVISLDQLLAEGDAAADAAPRASSPDDVTLIQFTSGTESDPKGAMHTHNTLLTTNRHLAQILGLGVDDSIFMASPLMHATGYGFGLRLAIYLGSTLVLQDGWDPAAAAALIGREQCTYTHGSTPFVRDLLSVADLETSAVGCLRYFVTGGAGVPAGFARQMRDLAGVELLRLYGQTEGYMHAVNRPGDALEVLESFDGTLVPGAEIWLDESEPESLPDGTGEAYCRGPHRCVGFVNDPVLTAAAFMSNGYMKTGDICSLDLNGRIKVVARRKEVINRGGYKFSPREVEDVLAMLPTISRVAVVRMSDARLGEKACAFVVPEAGAVIDLDHLVRHLRGAGVAPYKWPERLVLRDALPTTASGKVQKFVLEQELAAEAARLERDLERKGRVT